MKSFVTVSVLTFVLSFSLTSWASKNPQIRTCVQRHGEFFVAESFSNSGHFLDQFGFCRFGSAVIGASDLFYYVHGIQQVASIEAYKNKVQPCEPYGQKVTLQVVQGPQIEICQFVDNSMILLNTLSNGLLSSENAELNKALGLKLNPKFNK